MTTEELLQFLFRHCGRITIWEKHGDAWYEYRFYGDERGVSYVQRLELGAAITTAETVWNRATESER